MFSRRTPLAFTGLSLAVTLAVIVIGARNLRATPTYARELQHSTGSLGDWQFEYSISQPDDHGDYNVIYDFSHTSADDVKQAMTAINDKAAELAQGGTPFQATLVFAKPLSFDEFTAFARTHRLAPTENIVRAVDKKLGVLKMGAPPEPARDAHGRFLFGKPNPSGKPLDKDRFNEYLKNHPSIRTLGVISTDVTLDTTTYAEVQRDPRVFAVDVMQQVLTQRVLQDHPEIMLEHLFVEWSILYPAMEDTRIAPDPKT